MRPGNWGSLAHICDERVIEMSDRRQLTTEDVLSRPLSFPNEQSGRRLANLVGLDDHIEALTRDLRLIFDPQLIEEWSRDCYGEVLPVVDWVKDTVPLIVFQGDVGTGKTALAETIGQRIAEDGGFGVHFIKMNTQVRGTGYVGEMGTLIADAFKEIERVWTKKGEPVLFLIDEADSLLTSRDSEGHHHEDKSGVNTIIQHLDHFRSAEAQVAVIAITNRGKVLDPAVRRRATTVLLFPRPDRDQCGTLLRRLFGSALSDEDVGILVEITDEVRDTDAQAPFTYSDLTLRFAIPAVREAVWQGGKLDVASLARSLSEIAPTPTMADGGDTQRLN